MVMDNRYFPLFPKLYTGAHKDKSTMSASMVFMTGGEAYSSVPMANEAEKNIGYPALFGKNVDKQGHLDLDKIDLAIQSLTGNGTLLTNPFQTGTNADVNIEAHLQAQGFSFAGNVPVTSHFSLGWSAIFMRVIGEARLSLTVDAAQRMNMVELDATGKYVVTDTGQMEFVDNLSRIQKALDMNDNVWINSGSGDVVVYGSWYNSQQYLWKCRTVDFSLSVGAMIPVGETAIIDNIASVPFGGRGHWGWFAMPHLELELRDDLKIGLMGRLSKRFKKIKEMRVPVLDESPLFAPYKAKVDVTPGTTVTVSPYAVFEHVRSGFGMELKYTVTYHEGDTFVDARTDTTQKIKLRRLVSNNDNVHAATDFSEWIQEYATIKIVYDIGFGKDWRYRPMFKFTWDIPVNYVAGEGFAKTHGISLGCNFNF
jgi:hypothetical protein